MIFQNLFEHLAEVTRLAAVDTERFARQDEIWAVLKRTCRDHRGLFTTALIVEEVKAELPWAHREAIEELIALFEQSNRIEYVGPIHIGDVQVDLWRWNGDS